MRARVLVSMLVLYLLACFALPPLWALVCWRAIARLEARQRRALLGEARPPADYQL